MIVILALTYSVIEHIRDQVPEVGGRVLWRYDGLQLTGREKPFVVVEQLTDTNALLAAGRQDYAETYALQIAVHARSVDERSRLSYKVVEALRQPEIAFYDTSGTQPVMTDQTFVVDVTQIMPMPVADVENETDYHRAYIDAEITIYRKNQDGLNFTQ